MKKTLVSIEEILRNRILDITDEYRGRSFKRRGGVQVYIGYPQQMIDEINETIRQQILALLKEYGEEIIGEDEKPLFSERNKVGNWKLYKLLKNSRNLLRTKQRAILQNKMKKEDPTLSFSLSNEGVVLVLKKGKFIWKGKEVKDINKIYERFSEWMSKAELHPKKEEENE